MECKLYNVVIADDHPIVREGLKLILESDPEIKVVACVENELLAYEVCKNHEIDVVLMDIVMPELDGIEAAKMIQELNNDTKYLFLHQFLMVRDLRKHLTSTFTDTF